MKIDCKVGFHKENISLNKISIAIIGCGSVGSYLAMSLAESGIRKFLLMDNEILKPENTTRHLCSLADASKGLKKTTAVEAKLTNKFSDVRCTAYEEDILEFLSNDDEMELNNYDLMIVAVGKYAVERRINYAAKMGLLKTPVVYLWIEPYGVGGQVLLINSKKGGCFSCCFRKDEKISFLYSVSDSQKDFHKREVGCQTSYLPYSALDVKKFALLSCEIIIDSLRDKKRESRLYTYIGDVKSFIRKGYKISNMYKGDSPGTKKETIISASEKCDLCKKEL